MKIYINHDTLSLIFQKTRYNISRIRIFQNLNLSRMKELSQTREIIKGSGILSPNFFSVINFIYIHDTKFESLIETNFLSHKENKLESLTCFDTFFLCSYNLPKLLDDFYIFKNYKTSTSRKDKKACLKNYCFQIKQRTYKGNVQISEITKKSKKYRSKAFLPL